MIWVLCNCRAFKVAPRHTTSIIIAAVLLFGHSGALIAYGQPIVIRPSSPGRFPRLTNGFFVAWAPNSPELEVFNRNGSRIATLNILADFPEDRAASIYDAGVHPGRAIVVAACLVARNNEEVRGTLLYYDWRGALIEVQMACRVSCPAPPNGP